MADAISGDGENKGRPPFEPTDDERAFARCHAAAGDSDEQIAAALNVSLPTLRKHLAGELVAGRADIQPSLLEAPAHPSAPSPAPRKPGRKRYVPTREDRERVKLLAAADTPHGVIASRLGISEPTFRRAFSGDLETARAEKRAEIVELLHREARKGNVAAMRELAAKIDEADLKARALAATLADRPAPKVTAGKKVQVADAAQKAMKEGKWAGLMAPPKPLLQ